MNTRLESILFGGCDLGGIYEVEGILSDPTDLLIFMGLQVYLWRSALESFGSQQAVAAVEPPVTLSTVVAIAMT